MFFCSKKVDNFFPRRSFDDLLFVDFLDFNHSGHDFFLDFGGHVFRLFDALNLYSIISEHFLPRFPTFSIDFRFDFGDWRHRNADNILRRGFNRTSLNSLFRSIIFQSIASFIQ